MDLDQVVTIYKNDDTICYSCKQRRYKQSVSYEKYATYEVEPSYQFYITEAKAKNYANSSYCSRYFLHPTHSVSSPNPHLLHTLQDQ